MRYCRSASFRRQYRKLPAQRQEAVDKALQNLDETLHTGHPIGGLGLKELRYDLWEIRARLLDRIVFCRHKDFIEFLVVGAHDEIRRFLKRH